VVLAYMGLFLHSKGDYQESLKHLKKALSLAQRLRQPITSEAAFKLADMGMKFVGDNATDFAIDCYETALQAVKNLEEHSVHGDAYRAMTEILLLRLSELYLIHLPSFAKSFKYVSETVQLLQNIHGPKPHKSKLRPLATLSVLWSIKGDVDKALEVGKEAWEMSKELIGDIPHPYNRDILYLLGKICLAKKDLNSSAQYFKLYSTMKRQLAESVITHSSAEMTTKK